MCMMSVVAQDAGERWARDFGGVSNLQQFGPTRVEFHALKREVEELKELMKAARKYDEATGQPDCEDAQKIAMLRKFAEFVGVDLSDVVGAPSA